MKIVTIIILILLVAGCSKSDYEICVDARTKDIMSREWHGEWPDETQARSHAVTHCFEAK